jgi:N-acetylglucosamine-6-phosphate deacetylase
MRTALINGRVLIDAGLQDGLTVVIDGERIAEVTASRVDAHRTHDLCGRMLAPGFIDCQVNGGGGVLFNDEPTVDGVRCIAQAHRRFGTTGLLPTLISDDVSAMRNAVDAVAQAIEQRVPGVLGIHLEGPFLAKPKKGIHDANKFRAPDAADIELVTGGMKTLLTVAPEEMSLQMIGELSRRGVIVAAGHTNATFERTRAALDAGMRGFTHLYNAMSPLQSREPGAVGAALDDLESWCGIIVDGHHVHAAALRVALRAKPRGKVFLVTDAMPPVGSEDRTFRLNGETIVCRDGMCTDENGTLAGSVLDMAAAVRNAAATLGVDLAEALRMASQYPAAFIGIDRTHGRLAPGFAADLVVLNDDLIVVETWCAGRHASAAARSD